jgi:hypothetical protein
VSGCGLLTGLSSNLLGLLTWCSRDPWHWYADDETFDYIHTRITMGCWQDLREDVLQKAFDRLAPGGWFEAQEVQSTIMCDDDTMPPDYELKVHLEDLEDATAAMGRPLRIAHLFKDVMREIGFVDIEEVTYKIPINGWPRNRQYKQLGKMWEHNFLTGIHGLSVGPLHRVRGLSDKQIQVRGLFWLYAPILPGRDGHAPLVLSAASNPYLADDVGPGATVHQRLERPRLSKALYRVGAQTVSERGAGAGTATNATTVRTG